MTRMKTSGLCAVVCATLAAGIPGCAQKQEKPPEERIPVTVATAERRDIPVQVRAIGSVQPISSVAIRALVSGQLQRVWFREGEDVHKGQMLFTIDPGPYQATLAQAQANLARDEAQARNADAEAKRYAELIKKDYVTREEYDKFVSGAEAARAVVAADRAAVQNAQLQLAYCAIRSPLEGRSGSLQIQAGNLVKANDTTPLVTINQIMPVYVTFSVPESQLADVRARGLGNVPVSASPQQGGAPTQGGKLTFVDNNVDARTGTIALKATFGNEGRALWPGEFVNVAVTLSNRANATVVPLQAVQNGQKGQYVYVLADGGGVQMRPVTVVQQLETKAVIGQGVNPGDTVVTDGQLRLTPKSKVDVKKAL